MPRETHPAINSISLDDSNAAIIKKLAVAGFSIVEQTYSNPVANVWSLRICDSDCSLLSAEGTGLSKQTALKNALAKFVENLSSHYFWADSYLGDEISNRKFVHFPNEEWCDAQTNGAWPENVLNDELRDFYNPVGELNPSRLIDINSSNKKRGICCTPYECLHTSESINFPVNLVDNLYANNGIASGNSIEEARVNALSEILERYIQFKVIAEGLSLPNIPTDVINRYPNIQATIKEIQATGYKLVLQDASLDGHYPVIAVTLFNSETQEVAVSFSAHPNFEIALERCFTKLLHSKNQTGFSELGFDMDEIASPQNLEKHFNHLNSVISWQFLNKQSDYEFFVRLNHQAMCFPFAF